jgi:hypothetical protein
MTQTLTIGERPPSIALSRGEEEAWQQLVEGWQASERMSIAPAAGNIALATELEQGSRPPAFNVEADPVMRSLRVSKRQQAEATVEKNRDLLCAGEFDKVPMEADPGGTARKLVAIGRFFGKDSPEYQAVWQGLLRDCSPRIAEAMRKNGEELFDETVMVLDRPTGLLFSDGLCVNEMLDNGLTPAVNPHCPEEQPRRINDSVEVATDAALLDRPEMEEYDAYIFSQCPQSLIDRYAKDPRSSDYSDYVPAIQKLMIRRKRFDPASGELRMRQLAVPGIYINNIVINWALVDMKATDGRRLLDRTEVQGTQVAVRRDDTPSEVDMLRRLDKMASLYHGVPIYRGMPLQPGQKVDYEGIYKEAEERRQQQVDLVQRYAHYLVALEETGLDREIVGFQANNFVRSELLAAARQDPDQAEMMFDAETAKGFREIKRLEGQGRFLEADDLRLFVEQNAPAAGGCGAGSCGLEKLSAAEEKQAKELLDTQPGEQTAKDTERPCVKCGQKEVIYAWSGAVRKKGCQGCKATEVVALHSRRTQTPTVTLRRPKSGQVVALTRGRAVPVSQRAA